MNTEKAVLNGKEIEVVIELPLDYYEDNEVFLDEFEDTLDLSNDINFIRNMEGFDNYE